MLMVQIIASSQSDIHFLFRELSHSTYDQMPAFHNRITSASSSAMNSKHLIFIKRSMINKNKNTVAA